MDLFVQLESQNQQQGPTGECPKEEILVLGTEGPVDLADQRVLAFLVDAIEERLLVLLGKVLGVYRLFFD